MFKKNNNIVLRELNNTFFLIDITDNYNDDRCVLNEINDIAAFIWKELSPQTCIWDVVHKLKSVLNDDISEDELYNDVKEYIGYLLQIGLLEEGE